MANIRSQKKRIKTNEIARQRNRAIKSELRTFVSKFETVLESGDTEAAKAALGVALQQYDKAAAKGAVHRNYASRHKSRLSRRLNSA